MLHEDTHENKIYLNIVGGKIAIRAKADTPGAVKRYSEKKKEDLWEILKEAVSGTIKSMAVEDSNFGKQLIIAMKDLDEIYHLTLPVESKYFDSFCSKIQNADLTKEIKIMPYSFQPNDSDSKRTGINLFQEEAKLPYFYSKEAPKSKPMPASDKLDEGDWKIFKILERKFFCAMIAELKIGEVKEAPSAENPNPKTDDLPF